LVLLEIPDRRFRLRPEDPIHVEVVHPFDVVEHELQAFHWWLAGVLSPPQNRQTEGYLGVGLWAAHRDPLSTRSGGHLEARTVSTGDAALSYKATAPAVHSNA